jgi:DNA-binding transcriptional ArsR family regulator
VLVLVPLEKAAGVLRAINHPLRLQMLQLLHQYGHLTVTELYTRMGLVQSVASQHLALLRRAGFVTTLRNERFVHYSVNEERLEEVHGYCRHLLERRRFSTGHKKAR